MIYVFDENLPRFLAKMLDAFERRRKDSDGECCHICDRYGFGTTDQQWLSQIKSEAEQGQRFSVISKDRKMQSRPRERIALAQAGCHYFYFGDAWDSHKIEEVAWRLVKVWPKVVDKALNEQVPTMFCIGDQEVSSRGRVAP